MSRAATLSIPLFCFSLMATNLFADHDGTWHPTSPPGGGSSLLIFITPRIEPDEFPGRRPSRIGVFVTRDGSAIPLGPLVLESSHGNNRQILVAQAQGTNAACADRDGDGVGGLTQLTIQFLDTVEADGYVALIEPVAGGDIHKKGHYKTVVSLFAPDGSQTMLDGFIRLPEDLNVPR